MDKQTLITYLEDMDVALKSKAILYIYGSAAFILLDEPGRTSLDIDVAAPYSEVNEKDLREAGESVGLPVNPDDEYSGDHIEWIGPLRLCLQPPTAGSEITLWQGAKLRIQTGTVTELIASKLIRYDDIDQSDIRYLLSQGHVSFSDIESATKRLPPAFANDPLVMEHLANLKTDIEVWGVA